MHYITLSPQPATSCELMRMVEPLASYICATETPHAALRSTLAVLFDEVARNHAAARNHLNTLAEHLER